MAQNKKSTRIKKIAAEANQATGKIDTQLEVFDYMRRKDFPYAEKTLADYQKKINAMNFSDLQKHAIEIAHVIPNIERHRLVDRLEREYLRRAQLFDTKYSDALHPPSSPGMTKEREQNIKDILSKGR